MGITFAKLSSASFQGDAHSLLRRLSRRDAATARRNHRLERDMGSSRDRDLATVTAREASTREESRSMRARVFASNASSARRGARRGGTRARWTRWIISMEQCIASTHERTLALKGVLSGVSRRTRDA